MNCKDKGYEEGDVFEVLPDSTSQFSDGAIVVLIADDGSCNPQFGLAKGQCSNGEKSFFYINHVKRIYPPEKETVSITIEGKKAEISRESAIELKKTLNLIQDL